LFPIPWKSAAAYHLYKRDCPRLQRRDLRQEKRDLPLRPAVGS
jgi:hypothetical protein